MDIKIQSGKQLLKRLFHVNVWPVPFLGTKKYHNVTAKTKVTPLLITRNLADIVAVLVFVVSNIINNSIFVDILRTKTDEIVLLSPCNPKAKIELIANNGIKNDINLRLYANSGFENILTDNQSEYMYRKDEIIKLLIKTSIIDFLTVSLTTLQFFKFTLEPTKRRTVLSRPILEKIARKLTTPKQRKNIPDWSGPSFRAITTLIRNAEPAPKILKTPLIRDNFNIRKIFILSLIKNIIHKISCKTLIDE
jgi:hypothetical protein